MLIMGDNKANRPVSIFFPLFERCLTNFGKL